MSDPSPPLKILDDREDRYHRQRLVDGWDQERLGRGRVLVVGAGALGNEVLKNFALLGVGELWFADFDDIDASNLAKSVLFRPSDIGRPKVEVAAERLAQMDPDIRLRPISGDIRYDIGMGVFRRMDVLTSVVDSIDARVGFNRIAAALGVDSEAHDTKGSLVGAINDLDDEDATAAAIAALE